MSARSGEPISTAAAWRGRELFSREDWELRLSAAELDEIDRALRATRAIDAAAVDADTFRLPQLADKLARAADALETGSGAVWITGLEVGARTGDELERLFFGLARHIGTPVSQTAQGERLLRVTDRGFGDGDPRVRGPHTNKPLSFHTDRCDVIAFLCVRPAVEGGDNDVVSSVTLYNELLRRHPEQLRVLQEPFVYLRHTIDSGNARAYTRQPVFTVHQGHFAASFLRVLIDRADRTPGVPDLTDAQREALDTLESVAEDPALYARFRLAAGDILLLNCWVTFHRRTGFVDDPDPGRRRELLRLWLSVPNSRPLDPRFAEHFGATGAGELRGGIWPQSHRPTRPT